MSSEYRTVIKIQELKEEQKVNRVQYMKLKSRNNEIGQMLHMLNNKLYEEVIKNGPRVRN